MPARRNRIDDQGKPAPCVVRVPPALAAVLYRERLRGRYRDETELVAAILRAWAEELAPVDWPAVVEELRREAGEGSKP